MKKYAALLLAFSVLCSQGAVIHEDRIYRERAAKILANFNAYFDQLQPQISNFFIINGLDPLMSPDVIRAFSVTDLLGINWHGSLELTQGWIQDLSSVRRNGDALANYENKVLDLDIVLGFNDIVFDYNYYAEIMDIGPSGALSGKVTDLTIEMEIQANLVDMSLHLVRLDVIHAGTVEVQLEGGLLDFIANAIIDVVIAIFHDTIINVVHDAVFAEMQKLVDSINLYDIINGLNP